MNFKLNGKFTLTFALAFLTIMGFSQTPFSGTSQFRKFSIGINAGILRPSVITGGSNDFTKPLYTFGYGANLKYQFNHYFGVQLDALRGNLKGNNSKPLGTGNPAGRPVYSFNTDLKLAISLSGVVTVGNINWLSKKNTVIPYFTAGAGMTYFKPMIVLRGTTNEVPFDDGETKEEYFIPVGVGLKFKLSQLLNLDLGYRLNIVDNDNFDGARMVYGTDLHKDKFSYGFLGLEFALGKQSKPQLMFDNPAARANELLQTQVTNIQTQVDTINAKLSTTDTDGDGVFDQYDVEPNTPAGSPVDFRGVAKDSDGDGVPDFKDKQLITPTDCQPVDADGVGKCPEPECCKAIMAMDSICNLSDLPSISFREGSRTLSNDSKAMLATVASRMKNSAECTINITGYPAVSKASQSLCNRRLEAIKSYLVESEGITEDRIVTTCEPGAGDVNTVDLKGN